MLDVDLGIPITWPLFAEEAETYRKETYGDKTVDTAEAMKNHMIQAPPT
jgi:hypothetical protein